MAKKTTSSKNRSKSETPAKNVLTKGRTRDPKRLAAQLVAVLGELSSVISPIPLKHRIHTCSAVAAVLAFKLDPYPRIADSRCAWVASSLMGVPGIKLPSWGKPWAKLTDTEVALSDLCKELCGFLLPIWRDSLIGPRCDQAQAARLQEFGEAVEKTAALLPGKSRKKPRGRPRDTDPEEDARMARAWESGAYKTYADLASAWKTSPRNVQLAIDRVRHRRPSASE